MHNLNRGVTEPIPARARVRAMSPVRATEIDAKMRCGLSARFELLKQRLLLERLDEVLPAEAHAAVIQRASQAAAEAWLSGYPLLVFPCLFEEMASEATARLARQAELYWQRLELRPARLELPPERPQLCATHYLMRLRQNRRGNRFAEC